MLAAIVISTQSARDTFNHYYISNLRNQTRQKLTVLIDYKKPSVLLFLHQSTVYLVIGVTSPPLTLTAVSTRF